MKLSSESAQSGESVTQDATQKGRNTNRLRNTNHLRRKIIMEKIVKIGSVELYESDALRLYNERKYIVTYSRIYQLQGPTPAYPYVRGLEIYRHAGMTRRGRFHTMNAHDVNDLVGYPLVREA